MAHVACTSCRKLLGHSVKAWVRLTSSGFFVRDVTRLEGSVVIFCFGCKEVLTYVLNETISQRDSKERLAFLDFVIFEPVVKPLVFPNDKQGQSESRFFIGDTKIRDKLEVFLGRAEVTSQRAV